MNKLFACAALAAACPTAPASADPSGPPMRVAVRHADLNLASPEGIARLDGRIRVAITAVCGVPADFDLAGTNAIRRCRAQARAAVAPHRARLLRSAGAAAAR